MTNQIQNLYSESLVLLRNLSTKKGLLASTIASDNYKRIWARDSVICGLAGILAEDKLIIDGLKTSLLTLAKHQHPCGIIPSNVLKDNADGDVSYGSLVGRVDTCTWFIIGACLYYLNTKDTDTWNYLKPIIQKSRAYLKSIEFNGKGWIYTPISGNWADEYPIHGYTLYDNCLRLWGEFLWLKLNAEDTSLVQKIHTKTEVNFWPKQDCDDPLIYQKKAFNQTASKNLSHFCSFILPGIYDTRFDAAGNAMALLTFRLNASQKQLLTAFLESLNKDISKTLIPAFWPPIKKGDDDWKHIQGNYSFDFKNKPFHFHNGGIWPVWMGLFCLGLANNGMNEDIKQIISGFTSVISSKDWDFQEYISSNDLLLSGKSQMGFTASGIVFMYHALNNNTFKFKLGL